ncbi:Six-hairpin glycosidase-like protein [Mycotypha africana]|uniref:Six-hairpin glycosidase-like protein n=1 Tax=Mycotypha africana TaxID=64632 RepID=UPI0023005AFE|nr:Six-hairpin glycosidase-like protein [Mycotypha africana]KAI8967882.1 Six-hairpin glycosidase-like protein [Mycotypha africana]
MWIRDSTNQIKPYLRFVNDDIELKDLIFGVIQVQATYLNYDPYANAFLKPCVVWESKYELDSIGHFFQLTNEYLKATGEYDRVFKSKVWTTAIPRIFKVLQTQMQDTWPSKQLKLPNIKVMNSKDPQPVLLEDGYRFRRQTDRPTETLGEYGIGGITKRCGLIRSAFRPSDDATTLPYLIPANALVSSQLKQLSEYVNLYLSKHPENDNTEFFDDLKNKAGKLSKTIKRAIFKHAVIDHPEFGRVFAYEVDCYGSHLIMDDANTPSLLSMPLFGFVATTDKIYQNTRKMILSEWNPWFFQSEFGKGIGSPHTGQNMIWPLSLLMQLQTTTSEAEVKEALLTVKKIANVTGGLMCESIDVNKPDKYTRPWFSWANSVAGETILQLKEKYSDL